MLILAGDVGGTSTRLAFFEADNAGRAVVAEMHYTVPYGSLFPKRSSRPMSVLLGITETLCAFDTCQVDDYSKVVIESFDPVHKARRRKEVLPLRVSKKICPRWIPA